MPSHTVSNPLTTDNRFERITSLSIPAQSDKTRTALFKMLGTKFVASSDKGIACTLRADVSRTLCMR